MSAMASQITGFSVVCSTVCLGTIQRKHQISTSLAFVSDRWSVDSPLKGPVTRKMVPIYDVIMILRTLNQSYRLRVSSRDFALSRRYETSLWSDFDHSTHHYHIKLWNVSFWCRMLITHSVWDFVCGSWSTFSQTNMDQHQSDWYLRVFASMEYR